jgi:prepilin-type N-terminal cleavage/methylation domain-containing protein
MKRQKGMSLVEVLVAIVLMSVAALAITSTMTLVSSQKMRIATTGTLDLQASGYATQVLEALRNSVGTTTTTQTRLVDSSYGASCNPTGGVAGVTPCGSGTTYTTAAADPAHYVVHDDLLAISAWDSSVPSVSYTRSYLVQDIFDGSGAVAFKKATVSVNWTDPS